MNDPCETLPVLADAYCSLVGLSRSRVSTLAFGRGTKIDGLADGTEDIRTRTAKRALKWFSDNWPDGADWPADVARPISVLTLSPGDDPAALRTGPRTGSDGRSPLRPAADPATSEAAE